MGRIDKTNYYLDIAETVLERSTCLRCRYGAIIVHNDEIVSTGYNGAPRGRENCIDLGYCLREQLRIISNQLREETGEQLRIPHGERYELCRSVHAEMNAIISASRNECIGATLYLAGKDSKTGEYLDTVRPCSMCRRVIINAGIKKVVMRTGKEQYETVNVQEWVFNDDSIQERADDEAFSFELASNMPERP